ncbi:MAG: molybdopterin-dependent oxidoreductase [Acidobacteriota bacterium]|nr:molybdopterin-dependent oxidoreductase [Acidobacteriota bacterium]
MADKPWTWEVPEASESIKRTMSRQDAHERVSGRAAYTRDIYLPGMLYAKILTSPYAHAKIVSMDTREAEALVGVRDLLKFSDPDIAKDMQVGADTSMHYSIPTLPGTSDFYQHPMGVVVVADSEEICDKALRLIKIEWEERPFILDMEEAARPDAAQIMTEVRRMSFMNFGKSAQAPPNVILTEEREIGNVAKGFEEADKILEYSIHRAMNSPAGVEAMACVAQWRGDYLDLWVHHQANPQGDLSSSGMMGMMPFGPAATPSPASTHWSKITVTFPYQGSWFGGLAWLAYSTAFVRLAAVLAKRAVNKPVKLLYDESSFYCGGDEAGRYNCKVGAKKDGTITAYHWHMVGARNPAVDKTYECTKIPNIRGTQVWPFTNRGHQACFRHGAAACVPHNVMFDLVAAEFGLDPTEVALINDGCQGHDWDWITRYQKENGFPQRHSLKEVIEIGKQAIDWNRKWHAPGARKLANGRMHGTGFTSINEWHWGAGAMSFVSNSFACLMLRDGKVTIIGTRCDMGIDTESAYRHCVAAELGMKYEDVLIQEQRSDNSAYCLAQPAGSSGTVNATLQLAYAAREMKKQILERAATPMPGFMFPMAKSDNAASARKPEDFDIRDSMVFEKANPDRKRPVSQVVGGFMSSNPIIVHPEVNTPIAMMSNGMMMQRHYVMGRQAHFIEAEVDVETGLVEITSVVCVNDVGHIFNRQGAEAQQYGGAIMGIGKSATEEKVYCPKTGVGLNFDHINYHLGTMNDYPVVKCFLDETHTGYGTYGAFGIGENIGASMAAITSSAIYNAVGKWILDYPITPDKVLRALGKI